MSNDYSLRDPNTANCRIYVGNLKENTTKMELQNIFEKYGNIQGIMVSRNFGFIQFNNEQCANKAIENEHQQMYNNRRIVVSKIQKKNNPKFADKPNQNANANNSTAESSTMNASNTMSNQTGNNTDSMPNQSNANVPANNNSSNNMNNTNTSVQQPQNTGNHQSRPQWRNNRNTNNRNNSSNNNSSNNNNNNSNNEMNLQTDRERSPLDGGMRIIEFS